MATKRRRSCTSDATARRHCAGAGGAPRATFAPRNADAAAALGAASVSASTNLRFSPAQTIVFRLKKSAACARGRLT